MAFGGGRRPKVEGGHAPATLAIEAQIANHPLVIDLRAEGRTNELHGRGHLAMSSDQLGEERA